MWSAKDSATTPSTCTGETVLLLNSLTTRRREIDLNWDRTISTVEGNSRKMYYNGVKTLLEQTQKYLVIPNS